MYFGLDDENNPITEKEAIIQINNVSEDKNYVNVCLKNPDHYYYSSHIQTMPYNLVYYGDMDDFIFRGNISTEQTLLFFKKHGCFDGKVNYGYIYEKLENKKDAMVYDSEIFARSVMEYITSHYLNNEDIYDETKSVDDNRNTIYYYLEEHYGDYKEHPFIELMNHIDEGEECISKIYDILSDEFEYDYGYNLAYQTYTDSFKECCDRLCYFSGKILEMIGYDIGG